MPPVDKMLKTPGRAVLQLVARAKSYNKAAAQGRRIYNVREISSNAGYIDERSLNFIGAKSISRLFGTFESETLFTKAADEALHGIFDKAGLMEEKFDVEVTMAVSEC
jgi:hypothetical protein